MKKAKILAVFGILLAMGITACNKGGDEQSQETPVTSEQQGGGETSAHTHKFGSWTVVEGKEPTCTEKGQEQRVCECGEKEFRDKAALGHDFKNGTFVSDTATCTQDGVKTVKCARCDATQDSPSKAHHTFAESDVAAKGEGYVGYKYGACSKCSAKEVKIRALDGTFASGSSNKNGTPDGFMKLNSNGNEISWKFNVAGEKGLTGTLYQIGAMDAFSSNTQKTYAHTSSSSSTTVEKTEGNFRVTVNGTKVDKTSMIDVTFEEMTAGGEDSSALGDNYSPIAMCKIGDILLEPGDNTIVYRRLGSYNLVISDLVFIGTEFEHTHHAAEEWSKDANSHWHACDAPNCPVEGGAKLNEADHTFGEAIPVDAATCGQPGKEKYVCSVCGYEKFVDLPKTPHSYAELTSFASDGEGENKTTATKAIECSVCEETALEWKAADFNEALSKETELVKDGDTVVGVKMKAADKLAPASQSAGSPDKTVQGTLYVYKIDAYEAATDVVLSFNIKPYSGYGNPDIFTTQNGDWTPGYILQDDGETLVKSEYRYGLSVNGANVQLGKDLYGSDVKGVVGWYDFNAKFNLNKGVNTIEILCLGGYPADAIYGYRLIGMPKLVLEHRHTFGEWQSDGTNHWQVCTDPACPDMVADPTKKFNEAAHTLAADAEHSVAATCENAGVDAKKCSVCGKVVETPTAALGHKWVADSSKTDVAPSCTAPGQVNQKCSREGCTATQILNHYKDVGEYGEIANKSMPAEGGAVAYDIYNCGTAEHSHAAYVWNAKDFDSTETTARSDVAPDTADAATKGIRFGNGAQYKDKSETAKGTHLVYKVNVPAGVTYSVLSVLSTNRAKDTGGIFAWSSNDGTKGYEKVDGKFVEPTHRYGLIVNGERVPFGYDDYPTDKNDTSNYAWFSFPAQINLIPGQVNEIEIFTMGGYRLYMKSFRLSGMPAYVSAHTHAADAEWHKDANGHWHECTAADCDQPGIKLNQADHTWDDGVVTVEPGHTPGQKKFTCTVCGYQKFEEIAAVGSHEWVEGAVSQNSDNKNVTALSCSCGKVGARMAFNQFSSSTATNATENMTSIKMNPSDGDSSITFKIVVSKAGNYQLLIGGMVANNRTKTLASAPYTVTVGGNNVAVSSGSYESLKIGSSSIAQFVLVPTMALEAGENVIVISQGGGGYRLTLGGNVEVFEL